MWVKFILAYHNNQFKNINMFYYLNFQKLVRAWYFSHHMLLFSTNLTKRELLLEVSNIVQLSPCYIYRETRDWNRWKVHSIYLHDQVFYLLPHSKHIFRLVTRVGIDIKNQYRLIVKYSNFVFCFFLSKGWKLFYLATWSNN